MASKFGKAFQEARAKAKKEGRDPDKEVFEFGGKKFKAEMAKSSPSRKMGTEEFIKKYEESDTPAGRVTKTETETLNESPAMRRIRMAREMAKSKGPGSRYTPAQGMSMAERRMRGDSEESPAMARIRMAREMAKSKGPSTRATPVQGMSMAERRMREAGRMNKGGSVKKYAKGGSVSSASRRADGIAKKGKTRCKMV